MPIPLAPLLAGLLEAGPLVGHVTSNEANLWAAPARRGARCEVELRPALGAKNAPPLRVPLAPDSGGRAVRATIRGLEPLTRYDYRILVDGDADDATCGSFETAPPAGAPFCATFGIASCMKARQDRVQAAWNVMAEERPSLLLLIGDTHYGNTTERDALWRWNDEQRAVPSFARMLRTTPTLAVWDDHDYGANDSDGTLAGKNESLATWRELWANPPSGLAGTPGVFFQTSWGDVDLFFLDERYHRSPDRAPDDERKQMLGEEQFRWLERGLAASKATFKIVAGGSTLDASETDGWRLYSHARRRLFRALASTDGAIFVSGDVHRSFVTRFPPSVTGGHAIYEIVSSGVALGSPFLPDSFVTISIDTTARDPVIVAQVTRLGAEGEPPRRSRTVIRRSELQAH